jgi:hypothetical protein
MSSDSRASKRPRQCGGNGGGEDEPPLDLLSLYQSDFGIEFYLMRLVMIYVHSIYSTNNLIH